MYAFIFSVLVENCVIIQGQFYEHMSVLMERDYCFLCTVIEAIKAE